MENYEKLVERISSSAKITKEEVERKIEAKKAKLSGLISREGAAQIVAAELGINFEQEKMKISELVDGMKKVNLTGKVIQINPIREFNKNGREGKVASLVLADDSSNIRTVLWDTNHIALIEGGKIGINSVIEISNGSMRNNELHLSSFSDIKTSKQQLGEVIEVKQMTEKKFKDARPGDILKSRAVIVKTFEPKYFEVNPATGRKITEEERANGLTPQKKALLTIILDDGTETLRSTLFGDDIVLLGFTNEEIFSLEKFALAKNKILGEEKIFAGAVRNNALYNTTDFIIQKIENIKPEEIIKELEAKIK